MPEWLAVTFRGGCINGNKSGGESGEEITIKAIKPEANRDEARAKNNLRK